MEVCNASLAGECASDIARLYKSRKFRNTGRRRSLVADRNLSAPNNLVHEDHVAANRPGQRGRWYIVPSGPDISGDAGLAETFSLREQPFHCSGRGVRAEAANNGRYT